MYIGREVTDASGFYYMRGRYYAPGLARFISRDPAGLAGGINMYAYAGDDPVDFSDPTGLDYGWIGGLGGGYFGSYSWGPDDEAFVPGNGGWVGIGVGLGASPVSWFANRDGRDIRQGRQTNGGIDPNVVYARFLAPLPYVPDPNDPEALGLEWNRPKTPLENYYHPKNKQSLHPDPHHGPPYGPH